MDKKGKKEKSKKHTLFMHLSTCSFYPAEKGTILCAFHLKLKQRKRENEKQSKLGFEFAI